MVCRCGNKTTTHHDKLEVVVDLYTPTRYSKLEDRRRSYTPTTRYSKLEVVVVFTKYPFWSGKYSYVCMDFFK